MALARLLSSLPVPLIAEVLTLGRLGGGSAVLDFVLPLVMWRYIDLLTSELLVYCRVGLCFGVA